MKTLEIINTVDGKLTPESTLILEDGTHIPIPEALPSGSTAAPQRIGYTLGQHGYLFAGATVEESVAVNSTTITVNVVPAGFVSSAELAQALWPGCLDGASRKDVERRSASARRWASRMAKSHPELQAQSRVELLRNGRRRAILVWSLDDAMRIRAASLGSGNWKAE